MVTELQKTSLYEQDFLLWSEDTAAKLRARDFENLDLENLIEEVESLGRSDRKELLSRLVVIFEHLLKRLYVQLYTRFCSRKRLTRNLFQGNVFHSSLALQLCLTIVCIRLCMLTTLRQLRLILPESKGLHPSSGLPSMRP
ncbi:MAG: DUF29 domain-containing protein, partial [Prochlorotrichaceae cyanobacterium]